MSQLGFGGAAGQRTEGGRISGGRHRGVVHSQERDQRERSRGRNPVSTFPKLNFPDFKNAFEKDGSMGSESGRFPGGGAGEEAGMVGG